jgi:hypothetical protein
VDLTRTVYDNESQVGSAPLSLAYLDGYQEAGSLRADYALNPEMSIFVNGTVNNRSYDALQPLTLLNRNSSGYQLLVGGSFDITRLLRGQLGVGYLQQDYQSHLFHTVSGPAINGNVEYFLSGLTTITVSANRSVIDAVDPTAVSFAQTAGALSVDHELLRNVLVSARISYETDDFTGIQRHDGRASASISGTYLLNRYMGLHLGYSLLDETSTGAARISDYDVNVVSLSLVLQL